MENFKKGVEKLKKFLKRQDFVRIAYIFGSAAKGTAGPLSDVDLAFYLDERLSKKQMSDKLMFLINKISDILNTDNFDVVIMNDTDLLFSFNIVKHGKVLDSKDEHFRVMFETDVMSRFLDRDYYDTMYVRKDFERIAKEGIL